MRLSWHEIKLACMAASINNVLQKCSDAFKDELGTLNRVTVTLQVDPEATAMFFKPWQVLYAWKVKLERSWNGYCSRESLSWSSFQLLAAPIVPVLKEMAKICGDCKLTVKVSKLAEYLLPRVEELLDYQQLLLDKDSKECVTINTHKGLFKYNRLDFGVVSSPAIFQRTMDTLLQAISHVTVYLDDILATEEEHLANLEQVIRKLSEASRRLKWGKCTIQYRAGKDNVNADALSPVPLPEASSATCVTPETVFLGEAGWHTMTRHARSGSGQGKIQSCPKLRPSSYRAGPLRWKGTSCSHM